MLLALSGYAGSGKDTVGEILVNRHGFRRVAFADKVRAVARAIDPYVEVFGGGFVRLSEVVPADDTSESWSEIKKYPDVRRLLQRIGTEAGRETLYDNLWIEAALRGVNDDEDVVVTDARFINEFVAIRHQGGYTVRVNRPGTGPLNDHPSETEQDSWTPDFIIHNEGTIADLNESVDQLLSLATNSKAIRNSLSCTTGSTLVW